MSASRARGFAFCAAGTTAIEFGLVALPLLLMIMGTIEFGRLMWTRTALQGVATSVARCMGLVQSECGALGAYNASMTASFVQAQATGAGIVVPASGVTLNNNATCGGTQGFSQSTLTVTFNTVAPQLLAQLSLLQLTATACFPNQAS